MHRAAGVQTVYTPQLDLICLASSDYNTIMAYSQGAEKLLGDQRERGVDSKGLVGELLLVMKRFQWNSM